MSKNSAFLSQYIKTALWSSTDEDGEPLDDNKDASDIAFETIKTMRTECACFLLKARRLIRKNVQDMTVEDAAHDFWLTRCGHGSGFWDGDWGDQGDALSSLAESFGNVDLYTGDDGRIYQ